MIAVFAALFSLPQYGFAQDEVSPDAGVPESADAGEPEPEEVEEPVLEEPFVPDVEIEDDAYDDDDYQDDALQEALDNLPDGKPFAKGDIELGLGLGAGGSGDYFQLSVGGAFAYYVVNRLAPGIDLHYTHIFSSDWEYPDSFTVLPFLKFVMLRSTKFAPYLILAGGRDFQWGGSDDWGKGVQAMAAWILGGGAGAHIGLGRHVALKIQLLALYYWYDETKIVGVDDSWYNDELPETGEQVALIDENDKPCDEGQEGCNSYLSKSNDAGKDRDGKLFFPVISIGIAFMF